MDTPKKIILMLVDCLRYDFTWRSNIHDIMKPSNFFTCISEGRMTGEAVSSLVTGKERGTVKHWKGRSFDANWTIQESTVFDWLTSHGIKSYYLTVDIHQRLNQLPSAEVDTFFRNFPRPKEPFTELLRRDEKQFLFLHFWDCHRKKIDPRKDIARRVPEDITPLKYAVQYRHQMKSFIEEHLKPIERLARSERNVLILTSDHGELMGEYSEKETGERLWGHHSVYPFSTYDRLMKLAQTKHDVSSEVDGLGETPDFPELISIPLIVQHPKLKHCERSYVKQIDIAPTILKMFNVAIPRSVQGKPIYLEIGENEELHTKRLRNLGYL